MIYILIFVLTSSLFLISSKLKNRKMIFILEISAVILLSLFSGLRDYTVGTDNKVYILPYYEFALYFDYVDYINEYIENAEFGFLTIEYFAANVLKNPNFTLFVLAFITNLFIYLGIRNLRDKVDIAFAWFVYCCIQYNFTLNLMRQYVAVAIVFYLFSSEKNLKLKKVVLLTIFAMMFHLSAIITIPFFIVYNALKPKKQQFFILSTLYTNEKKYACFVGLLSATLILVSLFDTFIAMAVNQGIISSKYIVFTNNEGGISFGNIIFKMLGVSCYTLFYYNIGKHKNTESLFWLFIAFCDVIFLFNNNLLIMRLLPYFSIFEIIQISLGVTVFPKKSYDSLVLKLFFIIVLLLFWAYQFLFLKIGETVPYVFIS